MRKHSKSNRSSSKHSHRQRGMLPLLVLGLIVILAYFLSRGFEGYGQAISTSGECSQVNVWNTIIPTLDSCISNNFASCNFRTLQKYSEHLFAAKPDLLDTCLDQKIALSINTLMDRLRSLQKQQAAYTQTLSSLQKNVLNELARLNTRELAQAKTVLSGYVRNNDFSGALNYLETLATTSRGGRIIANKLSNLRAFSQWKNAAVRLVATNDQIADISAQIESSQDNEQLKAQCAVEFGTIIETLTGKIEECTLPEPVVEDTEPILETAPAPVQPPKTVLFRLWGPNNAITTTTCVLSDGQCSFSIPVPTEWLNKPGYVQFEISDSTIYATVWRAVVQRADGIVVTTIETSRCAYTNSCSSFAFYEPAPSPQGYVVTGSVQIGTPPPVQSTLCPSSCNAPYDSCMHNCQAAVGRQTMEIMNQCTAICASDLQLCCSR